MKDSIGSTILLKIFVVFMIVYIILMASILNYTKAFRIKNQVVNIINRYGSYNGSAATEIKEYFAKSDMYGECKLLEGNNDFGTYIKNRCEIKEYKVASVAGGSYYKVRVYVTFQFPLIDSTLDIPITGETKTLHNIDPPPSPDIKFVLVRNTLDIPEKELKPDDDCYDGKKVPEKACCSKAACAGLGELLTNGSSCACYYGSDEGKVYTNTPYCSALTPGSVLGDGNCYCCYDCEGVPSISASPERSSSSPLETVTVTLKITDNGNVGLRYCSFNGVRYDYPITITSTFSNKCVATKHVSCENRLGRKAGLDVSIYSKIDNCKTCNYSSGTCSECSGNRVLSEDNTKCCKKITNCIGGYDSSCNCKKCKATVDGCMTYDSSTCKCSRCDSTLRKCDDGSCKVSCPVKKCYCCEPPGYSKYCTKRYSNPNTTICYSADASKCN